MPRGRRRHRWEDNIKMDRTAVAGVDVNWTEPALDRIRCRAFMNKSLNIRFPLKQ
jgi:hypothetical protein